MHFNMPGPIDAEEAGLCCCFFLPYADAPFAVSLPNPNPDSRSRPSYVIVIIS